MMFKAGHGVTPLSSITLHVMHLVRFAFANDTDLMVAGQHADATCESTFSDFQAAFDRWAGRLTATGGALSQERSFCYLIDFR